MSHHCVSKRTSQFYVQMAEKKKELGGRMEKERQKRKRNGLRSGVVIPKDLQGRFFYAPNSHMCKEGK